MNEEKTIKNDFDFKEVKDSKETKDGDKEHNHEGNHPSTNKYVDCSSRNTGFIGNDASTIKKDN